MNLLCISSNSQYTAQRIHSLIDGIARGNEALTLLDYTTTRDIFINQSMQVINISYIVLERDVELKFYIISV